MNAWMSHFPAVKSQQKQKVLVFAPNQQHLSSSASNSKVETRNQLDSQLNFTTLNQSFSPVQCCALHRDSGWLARAAAEMRGVSVWQRFCSTSTISWKSCCTITNKDSAAFPLYPTAAPLHRLPLTFRTASEIFIINFKAPTYISEFRYRVF